MPREARVDGLTANDFAVIAETMNFVKNSGSSPNHSHIYQFNRMKVEITKNENGEVAASVSVTEAQDPVLGGYRDR